jgi:ABC-type polysaccharide/polyol phosphate transport system ATPase subunit
VSEAASAVRVEGLSKRYLVGHNRRAAAGDLREALSRNVRAAARRTGELLRGRPIVQGDEVEDFWALRDVSFEVARGEVMGVVGRNGAGKSTLLKILSRITEPSEGRVTLHGRVASLLEVGTGFHGELSGAENIYLNGAILGMRREEIRRKFDEIVAFAEVEPFIDTPVKRYSSGMYVRLAFAVAAHLEPEILVVDEVLAVGDQQFQQKSLGKIGEVAAGGRTVLVVSHNLPMIATLCRRSVLLDHGRVREVGATASVLGAYAKLGRDALEVDAAHPVRLDAGLELREISCEPPAVASGSSLRITVRLGALKPTRLEDLSVLVYTASGERAAIIDLRAAEGAIALVAGATHAWRVELPRLDLVEGEYSLGLYSGSPDGRGDHYNLCPLTVLPGKTSARVVPYASRHRGAVELDYTIAEERGA